ncbi:segregation/condensation protein A [Candidatus Pacearchaeota archaeon]|nr:segregation/condensation protein A [Candidatus Pacearchaeota archaeon]
MEENKEADTEKDSTPPINAKQEQVHDLIFSRQIDWQEIIYDLINTEQLDPWDVDIVILSDKYLEKIQVLEEADFFVSSKVLLAASLLLRIKSEILLNKYIWSIDEILFGGKEAKKYELERIELDEDIPSLTPKSPIPRFRKVTLQELMESLNKAIKTENRRIYREIVNTNALREVGISLPKRKVSIKDKIKEIYNNLALHFNKNADKRKVSFSEFVGKDKEERIISFGPLLHLENQKKIWLDQEKHFDEIYIWLKEVYFANNPDPFADLREQLEEEIGNLDAEGRKRLKQVNEEFENPLADFFDGTANSD